MSKKFVLFLFLFLCPLIIEAREIIVPLNEPTIQGAINVANNGDKIIISKGEYPLNNPLIIKDKENFSLIAKGKVVLTNRKGSAIILENSNISIKGINFFRNEEAISISSSVLSADKCSFEKNKVGIKILDSTLVADNCFFKTNYLAGIFLIGEQNVVKITPENKFYDNYVDVLPQSLNPFCRGNRILLGKLED